VPKNLFACLFQLSRILVSLSLDRRLEFEGTSILGTQQREVIYDSQVKLQYSPL
jgi:hypothetical protein